MGKVLLKCPECDGTEDFVIFNGQLSCLCGVSKADDAPYVLDNPPADYDFVVADTDETAGLGKPFKG